MGDKKANKNMTKKQTKKKAVVQPKRVMVVEDDKNLRMHMARVLELGGYAVSVAANGEEALALLQTKSADLVITDVLMPRMDGFQLATKLEELHPETPVIVMSGTRSHSAQFSGPGRPNVRKFLLKPVSLDLLINSVLEVF